MQSLLAILVISVISVAFGCFRQTEILCETGADCQARGWESCEHRPNATHGVCKGRMANVCSDDEFCMRSGFGLRCEKAINETMGSCKMTNRPAPIFPVPINHVN